MQGEDQKRFAACYMSEALLLEATHSLWDNHEKAESKFLRKIGVQRSDYTVSQHIFTL